MTAIILAVTKAVIGLKVSDEIEQKAFSLALHGEVVRSIIPRGRACAPRSFLPLGRQRALFLLHPIYRRRGQESRRGQAGP